MPEQEEQNNNMLVNSFTRSDENNHSYNEQENNMSSDNLVGPDLPTELQRQFDELSKKIREKLHEGENQVFERLQLKLVELEKQVEEADKDKKNLEKRVADTMNAYRSISKKIQNANHSVNKMSRQVKITERKTIEFLGIFVTLFTFISVSASTVLQFKTVYHAIFFLLAFCFCLLLFLHVFHIILRNEKIGTKCWIIFYIVVLVSCTGGAFLCHLHVNKFPNIYDDKQHSIQINYRQTNEYDQTINHEKKIPLNPAKK